MGGEHSRVPSLAKCPQIVACTPSGPGGKVADSLLAALHLAGVTEVYRVGGVQAIGAMAFGTASIPAVDKICGPEPLTQADEVRERRRKRLQKALPEIDIDRRRPRG